MNLLFRLSCLCIAVTWLSACSNDSQSTASEEDLTQQVQDYVSILPDNAPVIKVATTGTMPPFSFQDEYGNMMGIDIDAIRAIGEESGFKVEFYQEPWQNLFNSVENGQRDLAVSGISFKPERAVKYGLSSSYIINPSAIMYLQDNPVRAENGLYGLRGKRVGAMEASKQEEQIKAIGGYSELHSYKSTFLLFEALIQDKVDAILQDEPLLKYTALNHPKYPVKIVPYESPTDPLSQQVVVMAKTNTDLINKVNAGIAKIKGNGKMAAIEYHWLSNDNNKNTPKTN